MTATKKTNGATSDDPQWWTHRECQVFLGNISKQRWARIRAEHAIACQTDDRGVDRFSAQAVIDLGERLGLAASTDHNHVALEVLRDTIESQGEYVKLLQDNIIKVITVLRDENDSLRKLRAEEQAAHLKSLEATQEALDHSAERAQMLQHAQGIELRQSLALEWLMQKIGPKIMQQWEASGHVKKIVSLVQGLDNSQVEALKVLVTDEQREAIESLRRPEPKLEGTPANG